MSTRALDKYYAEEEVRVAEQNRLRMESALQRAQEAGARALQEQAAAVAAAASAASAAGGSAAGDTSGHRGAGDGDGGGGDAEHLGIRVVFQNREPMGLRIRTVRAALSPLAALVCAAADLGVCALQSQNQPMSSVANHIAGRLGVSVQAITLSYEGEVLFGTQTAADLGIDNDEIIEAKIRA